MLPKNIHTHPREGYQKFQEGGGGGGLKSKNIDGKYELTLEFAEGLEDGGCQTKNYLWEG